MFALFGLKQTLKITDKWSVDGGVDRSQTIRNSRITSSTSMCRPHPGTARTLPPSRWAPPIPRRSGTGTPAWRCAPRMRKTSGGSLRPTSVSRRKDGGGRPVCQLFDTKAADGSSTVNGDLRLGMVYRPLYTRWIILDRLDVLYDRQHGGAATTSGTSFNIGQPADRQQSERQLQAGQQDPDFSPVWRQIRAGDHRRHRDYSGYTDLIGVEGRYDLTKKWDVGLRGSVLHSWSSRQINYSAGLRWGTTS